MSTVFDEAVLEERPEIDLSVLPTLQPEREDVVVLALDIGTSGTRAAMFDSRGAQIEGALVKLPSESRSQFVSGADVDADQLVGLIERTLDLAVEHFALFVSRIDRIDYVALSCFWHSLVGVDESGNAITPLLGWGDLRAAEAATELRAQLDERSFHTRTGCRFHPSYWPAKLSWLKKAQPAVFDRASHWLSFSDYLFLRLLGDRTTSVSMASGTGLLDQTTCEWDGELLAALGLRSEQLPPIARPSKTVHGLTEEYCLRWPVLDGAAWFPAIGDGAANNIGAGCVSSDRVALTLGTSGAIRMLSLNGAPTTLPPELFCYRADRDRVVVGGALSDGGSLLAWMKESLGLGYGERELDLLLDKIEPDAHGLTILPFWSGERAPGWSLSAGGAIAGLKADTRSFDILRATMESVCFRFALIARALEGLASNAAITLTGKPFLSYPVWAQMMADVLGRRVTLLADPETTTRGAALLALETIGTIDSLDAIKTDVGGIFLPDMARHEIYARAIARQEQLYRRLIT